VRPSPVNFLGCGAGGAGHSSGSVSSYGGSGVVVLRYVP
jgi:hypothetical protein